MARSTLIHGAHYICIFLVHLFLKLLKGECRSTQLHVDPAVSDKFYCLVSRRPKRELIPASISVRPPRVLFWCRRQAVPLTRPCFVVWRRYPFLRLPRSDSLCGIRGQGGLRLSGDVRNEKVTRQEQIWRVVSGLEGGVAFGSSKLMKERQYRI